MSPHLIVSDRAGEALAQQASRLLHDKAVVTTLSIRERFPVADSMAAFLARLNDQEPKPLLVLSDSSESVGWLLPEIEQNPQLYSRIVVLLSNTLVSDRCAKLTVSHITESAMNALGLLGLLECATNNA